MTTQKEKNVLDFKDKDILKNHKVASNPTNVPPRQISCLV